MGLDSVFRKEVEEKFSCRFCARNRSRYFLIAGGSGSANFVVKPTFDFTVGGLFSPLQTISNFTALMKILVESV
jgi:hypothetical protein